MLEVLKGVRLALRVGAADRVKVTVLAEDYAGYGGRLWAQHGTSFLVDVEAEGLKGRILFDTATYAEPLIFNMKALNVQPSTIDYIVLSHCHYDHTGGLLGLLRETGGKPIPVIAHPEIFRQPLLVGGRLEPIGAPVGNLKEEVEKLGGMWILTRDPLKLFQGVTTTGEVERVTEFERETTLKAYTIEAGRLVRDGLVDDLSLALNVKGSLVVISGCSHAGIVNIVKKASSVTGVRRIRAVMGGFHLVGASEQRIKSTVKTLRRMGVKEVYTGHCTGFRAECLFAREFGGNFRKLYCGMTAEF